MLTVISVKDSQGVYQDKQYHNFNVYGLNSDTTNPKVVAGGEVEVMKIKADDFVAILNRNIGALNAPNIKKVEDIIGLYITPVYNRWGNVEDFTLSIPEDPLSYPED